MGARVRFLREINVFPALKGEDFHCCGLTHQPMSFDLQRCSDVALAAAETW
jgi:hypothetical protein